MAAKGKFHIPSISEMDKQDKAEVKVQSTFAPFKANGNPPPTNSYTGTAASTSVNSTNQMSKLPSSQSQLQQSAKPLAAPPVSKAANTPISAASNPPAANVPPSPVKTSATNQPGPPQSSPARPGSTNSIIVSARQRGNPILKHIRNIPWEFGDIVPDYQLGQTSCALFLSLRYHQLNPNYIHERLKQLGHTFDLRVLLVQVDIKDPHPCLKDLAKMCILADCTLILAFNPEEAGRYLETYKSYENKPPDLIMERTEGNLMARMTDTLTKVKSVNKTDAMTLMSAFGSFAEIVGATQEDISLCPGFGPQKAKRLHSVLHEPFLSAKRKSLASREPNQSPTKKPS